MGRETEGFVEFGKDEMVLIMVLRCVLVGRAREHIRLGLRLREWEVLGVCL